MTATGRLPLSVITGGDSLGVTLSEDVIATTTIGVLVVELIIILVLVVVVVIDKVVIERLLRCIDNGVVIVTSVSNTVVGLTEVIEVTVVVNDVVEVIDKLVISTDMVKEDGVRLTEEIIGVNSIQN